jgi:cell division transport system permease protein
MEMLWTNIRRIVRGGLHNFWRNGFVSLASVLVMVITLSVLGSILFADAILSSSLNSIERKVDVTVYFTKDAPEEEIMSVKDRLEQLSEVASVTYTSRDQALTNFRDRYENDQTKIQALEELDNNPLRASLNIRAEDPSQYQAITEFLRGSDEGDALSSSKTTLIDEISYQDKKVVIDRLSTILNTAERLGVVLMIVMVALAVIITFNTIRLAIYISREEIAIMRLVGASKSYIRGPFVVSGMLYGIVSGLITLILFVPVTYWLADVTQEFFIGFDVFQYYLANFGYVTLWVIGSGIVIGALSSYLAVKRYLKV